MTGVRRREGAGRGAAAGADDPDAAAAEARLQGRRVDRARRSTASARRRHPCSAARPGVGQGFKYFMGGIELGRVQRRRARRRDRAGGAFDDAIRYAQRARGVRQADRAAPGDPADARADGDARSRPRGCCCSRRREQKDARRARRPRGRDGEVLRDRDGAGDRARRRCASTAATATRRSSVVERYYRDAPLLILGEGSNEIQQLVIARRLLERHAI